MDLARADLREVWGGAVGYAVRGALADEVGVEGVDGPGRPRDCVRPNEDLIGTAGMGAQVHQRVGIDEVPAARTIREYQGMACGSEMCRGGYLDRSG